MTCPSAVRLAPLTQHYSCPCPPPLPASGKLSGAGYAAVSFSGRPDLGGEGACLAEAVVDGDAVGQVMGAAREKERMQPFLVDGIGLQAALRRCPVAVM